MQTIRRVAGIWKWTVPALALMLALGVSACYEDYNLGYKDYDTALTQYDKAVNFAAYKYFVMPDTIVHIIDTTQLQDPLAGARKYDDQILSLVRSNFIAHGYQYLGETGADIPPGVDPNQVMAVFVGEFAIEYTGYYYGYWGGYWGYWWGWYYPYYPPYTGTYEFSTGTCGIEAVDYGKSQVDRKVKPLWFGAISGLTGDTPASVQQRIGNNINQLFLQSPYLYAGQ